MDDMTTAAVYHEDESDLSRSGSGGGGEDGVGEGYDWVQILKHVNTMSVVIYILVTLVCVLGVLGNGVVIWATGFRMKKSVSTFWYLNLAVANFLFAASLPLSITERALDFRWPFGRVMCMVDAMLFYMNMHVSVFTLVVIIVDRCVCVACPVWARNHRSVMKASWVSLGVWVLAWALSIPGFIFRDTAAVIHLGENITVCNDNFALDADLNHFRFGVMILTNFLAGFVVPFAVIISCYIVIIYRFGNNRSLASQSGRSSFKILAIVIAVFFLCWAPFHVIRLIHVEKFPLLGDTLSLVILFGLPLSHALTLLNSCLNPLLYVFIGQGFKDVLFRRSIMEILEEAFAEEPSHTDTPTEPAATHH